MSTNDILQGIERMFWPLLSALSYYSNLEMELSKWDGIWGNVSSARADFFPFSPGDTLMSQVVWKKRGEGGVNLEKKLL